MFFQGLSQIQFKGKSTQIYIYDPIKTHSELFLGKSERSLVPHPYSLVSKDASVVRNSLY